MYRIVAVLLCTLNGCPVRMILLAIILVVSGLMKVPVATKEGAVYCSERPSGKSDITHHSDPTLLSEVRKTAGRSKWARK
jgi:hypothetical protein